MGFEELRLNQEIMHGLRQAGFEEPTEIQVEVIPLALQGEDLVVQAKTGTGKTAAFALPLLNLIDAREHKIKALVLTPVRELAQQVTKEIYLLGKNSKLDVFCVYGGQSINVQMDYLRRPPQILVGTPGRIIDLFERGKLDFSRLEFLVLDEADKMFEMGFKEDVETIISFLPVKRQTMLFSATIAPEIKQIAKRHMRHFIEINHSQDSLTVQEVRQFYYLVDPRKKIRALIDLLNQLRVSKGLIFCNTTRYVDRLASELRQRKIRAVAMHGGFSQRQREHALAQFNSGRAPLLIATNVASRGLHIDDVSHVFNFDFPKEGETYVHRIGRTARQGQQGMAITFVTNLLEKEDLDRIIRKAKTHIQEIPSRYA
jgi:ATP-dependent RNA helicase DeaD